MLKDVFVRLILLGHQLSLLCVGSSTIYKYIYIYVCSYVYLVPRSGYCVRNSLLLLFNTPIKKFCNLVGELFRKMESVYIIKCGNVRAL